MPMVTGEEVMTRRTSEQIVNDAIATLMARYGQHTAHIPANDQG